MSESRTDFELLRDFIQRGDQRAFAEVARRHLGLVYATALRKTEDEGAAEEVAQNVFAALAKKAWRFGPEDSVAAWLYRTTLLEAKEWVRGELRRRRRDQTAAELGTTMKTPDEQTAFRALLPLLDEALLSLREKERTALLLRFYESQSLREVGAVLGVTEDTAQKRVASALEKIAHFFQRRGYKTASVAAATAAFQYTAKSAPAAAAAKILGAATLFTPPAGFGLGFASRVIGMSKVQAVAACVAVAIVPLAWQWQQMHSSARALAAMVESLKATDLQYRDALASLETLRGEEARLAAAERATAADRERRESGARKLETLRAQAATLAAGEENRWEDEAPFARVPKSAIASLRSWTGPLTPDKLQIKVETALGLNPQEKEAAMQVFSNYFSAIDQALKDAQYESNLSARLKLPEGAESRVFGVKPLGPEIRRSLDDLCSNLETLLGPDRWSMVNPDRWEMEHYEQVRLLGYGQFTWDQGEEVAANIFTRPSAEPTVSFTGEYGFNMSEVPLKFYLRRSNGVVSPGQQTLKAVLGNNYPESLKTRLSQWMAAQAAHILKPTDQ
jgi:RNA polymerase sigma factor (sigma-70 family)